MIIDVHVACTIDTRVYHTYKMPYIKDTIIIEKYHSQYQIETFYK